MTKHMPDELKCGLSVDAVKVDVTPVEPPLLDDSLVIAAPLVVAKPKKVRMVKAKVTPKKSLDRVTSHLYDLEDSHGPEKCLNIDLGLYQMEDF